MARKAQAIGFAFGGAVAGLELFGVLAMVGLLYTTEMQGAPLATPPYVKTNLMSFLAWWTWILDGLGVVCELEPEWVGTVKRAYLRGGEGVYKEDQPNNIRFSHLMVLGDQLVVYLLRAHGGGELKLDISGTNARIDVKGYAGMGGGAYGSQNVSAENLGRAAEQCRKELKERYPGLR